MAIIFSDKGNYKSFKKNLKKVLNTFKDAPKIILVLDNVRYHLAKVLNAFLERNKKMEILYLPTYSPDLNTIERAWWFMRKSITRNKVCVKPKNENSQILDNVFSLSCTK